MIETCYISCACNRSPHAADWGRNNLVCYAANHAVAVYDPASKKFGSILSTLHAHTDKVNVVRWIKPYDSKHETEFISASSDGTAIIWREVDNEKHSFKPTNTLRTNEPLTICDAIYLTSNSFDSLVCTGSVNGDFRLWLNTSDKIEPLHSLNLNKKLPTTARLAKLQKNDKFSNILLFIAMEDSSVHLYTMLMDIQNVNENKFENLIKIQSLVGHEDWVTCIDFIIMDTESLFLATGSQDNTIRLWKISSKTEQSKEINYNFLKRKNKNFSIQDSEYEIILESIICGHDAWIYGLQWHPLIESNGKFIQPLKLLSSSLDKTAIIWEFRSNTGTWSETTRVGDVGGNSLGLYGGKFGPNGSSILTYGYDGSFHMWKHNVQSNTWEAAVGPSGHYDSVMDLCWEPRGKYMLTTSSDQTTRAHAPWSDNNEDCWHEIARPQIHGYDMTCIAIFKPFAFASGAEEKVVRIFEAPPIYKKYFEKNKLNDTNTSDEMISTPSLNLSNKASSDDKFSKKIDFNKPPLEDELVRCTLWPELQKLYGHSYEIISMSAQSNGSLLATSSKSSTPEHAAIILWDTRTWHQIQKLFFHQLTVTQLAFSPDEKHLLSVSRDRRWALYSLENEKYNLILFSSKNNSYHKRIIWCCAWTTDSKYFATGSRDGRIGIWNRTQPLSDKVLPVTELYIKDTSITALAFAAFETSDQYFYLLAIGYENGCIDIRKIKKEDEGLSNDWSKFEFLDTASAHHLTVKRLSFRPKQQTDSNIIQLASCGSDGIVKIYNISLK